MVTLFKSLPIRTLISYLIPIHTYENYMSKHKISKLDLNDIECLDCCSHMIVMGPLCETKRWLWIFTTLRMGAWNWWLGHPCNDFLINQTRSVIMVLSYRPTFLLLKDCESFCKGVESCCPKRIHEAYLENFNGIHYAYILTSYCAFTKLFNDKVNYSNSKKLNLLCLTIFLIQPWQCST